MSDSKEQEVHLMKKRDQKGFTLIELLIVVAIIGIIVAIAIPNLLNAIQRAKQKRTMADMRSAGTAAEAYAVDFNHYPAAAAYTLPTGLTLGTGTFGAAGSGFNGQVVPTYIRLLPTTDGWQSYFTYTAGPATTKTDYGITSYGKDGVVQGTLPFGETTDFNADIVFVDGQFVQYPAGAQR
jgi:type II secretion system protein G